MTEEYRIRKYLWLNHGCPPHLLYGDDGEMQCGGVLNNRHKPLDFKRQPITDLLDEIEQTFYREGVAALEAAKPKEAPHD